MPPVCSSWAAEAAGEAGAQNKGAHAAGPGRPVQQVVLLVRHMQPTLSNGDTGCLYYGAQVEQPDVLMRWGPGLLLRVRLRCRLWQAYPVQAQSLR